MMSKRLILVLCVITLQSVGCDRAKPGKVSKSDSNPTVKRGSKERPHYVIDVLQLHPNGRYWKKRLGNPHEGEGHATAMKVSFAPSGERTFPLELEVRFIEHRDGQDIYYVSRNNPPSGENSWNAVSNEIRFRGEPIVVFDDEYGTTVVLNSKRKLNR